MKALIAILLMAVSFTANADWSLIGGIGRADFAWCAGDGCWHQPPLPYADDRSGSATILGLRYEINKNLAIDGLYHAMPTSRVYGTYVPDDDYNPVTHEITPGAYVYETGMIVRTNGISLSAVPKLNFGDTSVFGRIGMFKYYQSVDFSHPGESVPYWRESGRQYTWMIGAGIGHTFGPVTIAIEAMAFPRVKFGQSPIGGDLMRNKDRFGLVEYLFTVSHKF